MRLDAVRLEVMAHAFASIAEEMGLVLVHSALSPNIRERRDASAALFDADGEMIAQAAHIPVHLGALADAVAAVRRLEPFPQAGEMFILNDPYGGGSHLPDLTLIGAIDIDGQVGGYSVVRAHHSDVGGMTPGSMPASARELYQEGIIIPPTRLTLEVERLLLANVRTPAMRRGDLAAQRAAVERGAQGLRALARRHGWNALREAARELLDYAERRTKSALSRLPSAAPMTATDYLEGDGVIDHDLEICVRITIQDGIFHANFAGTRDAAPGNVNCPMAVTRSAVLFVVRTLLPDDVPMNGGVPRAIAAHCGHGLSRTCGRRLRRAGAGSGDDEQRDVWRNRESGVRSLDLLRNDWRRAGRESRGQRTVGCPRRDVKHTQHADRSPGNGASRSCPDVRTAPWQRGTGDVEWRRWRGARVRGARADGGHAPDRAAASRPGWSSWRIGGRSW